VGPYSNQPQSKSLGIQVFQQEGRAAGAATGDGSAVAMLATERVTARLMRLANFITIIKSRALEEGVGQRQSKWKVMRLTNVLRRGFVFGTCESRGFYMNFWSDLYQCILVIYYL